MPNKKLPKSGKALGRKINVKKGSSLPKTPKRKEAKPVNEITATYGYSVPSYAGAGQVKDLANAATEAHQDTPKPMAYKKSSCTYKLPGEGSRENYSEGTFRKDNRAMQAGLIVDGGFGDLSSSYKGSSPAAFGNFSGIGGSQLTQAKTPSSVTPPVKPNVGSGEEEKTREPLDLDHAGYSAGPGETFEGMPVNRLQ